MKNNYFLILCSNKRKSEQYFNIIWMLINAVDNIEEETDEFRKKVYDIDSLYTYQINKVFTQNETVDTNVCNDIGILIIQNIYV